MKNQRVFHFPSRRCRNENYSKICPNFWRTSRALNFGVNCELRTTTQYQAQVDAKMPDDGSSSALGAGAAEKRQMSTKNHTGNPIPQHLLEDGEGMGFGVDFQFSGHSWACCLDLWPWAMFK